MSNLRSELARKAPLLLRLSRSNKLLLVEGTILLGLARAAVLLLPFRHLAPSLGAAATETSHDCASEHVRAAVRIGRALQRLSSRLPWECNCLTQAVAAKWMLRRRRIACTLYLGLCKQEAQLTAHAWLRVGSVTITGGGQSQFTVVSSYGGYPR